MNIQRVVYKENNLKLMKSLPDKSFGLIYTDPPFGTGKKMTSVPVGKGHELKSVGSYKDPIFGWMDDLRPRLEEMYRLLKDNGTLYLHLDWRGTHHARLALDEIFGRDNFLNEIIWAYDYGGRGKTHWPRKHDNILVYTKNHKNYYFNRCKEDFVPRSAPSLAKDSSSEKFVTDVWWNTIVHTNGKERTGYPTQKPLAIVRRIVRTSCAPDDMVFDPYAGSGTTAEAAQLENRSWTVCDENQQAIDVMVKRFGKYDNVTNGSITWNI